LSQLILDADLQQQLSMPCKLFYGEQGPGESCTDLGISNADDCEADLECSTAGGMTGTCAIDEVAAEGQPCSQMVECDAGLLCFDVDGDGQELCESLPIAGETCKGMADLCDIDLYCEQTNKVCTPLPGAGEPCNPGSTFGQRCTTGNVCNDQTGDCEVAPGAGEACTDTCAIGFNCTPMGVCAEETALVCALG
jgi:hypothetical protein